jgi:hypothetical protein
MYSLPHHDCAVSKLGGNFQNRPTGLESKVKRFTVEFDATPHGFVDEVFALSNGPQLEYEGFSCLIRFSSDSRIQMWSGEIPAKSPANYDVTHATGYIPNTQYHFRITADANSQKCSGYVSTITDKEHFLGTFKFRASASGLDNFGFRMDTSLIAQTPDRLAVDICNIKFLPFSE